MPLAAIAVALEGSHLLLASALGAGLAAIASGILFGHWRATVRAADARAARTRAAGAPGHVRGPTPELTVDGEEAALLERVAGGQTAFLPDDQETPEAGERFDRLVGEVLRLQSRGLITGATAWAEVRVPGREYAAITNVALTPLGWAAAGHVVSDERAAPHPAADATVELRG
jgi:hypothetical protein